MRRHRSSDRARSSGCRETPAIPCWSRSRRRPSICRRHCPRRSCCASFPLLCRPTRSSDCSATRQPRRWRRPAACRRRLPRSSRWSSSSARLRCRPPHTSWSALFPPRQSRRCGRPCLPGRLLSSAMAACRGWPELPVDSQPEPRRAPAAFLASSSTPEPASPRPRRAEERAAAAVARRAWMR